MSTENVSNEEQGNGVLAENVSNEEQGNGVLADVTPSNLTLKVTNCRGIAKLQDIANGIGKDRVINIQKMYPDDDIYFLYYWG